MQKIKWGLLACGAIAKAFANGIKDSETGTLYAVASRSGEKARTFAEMYGAEAFYGSYEELLADADVDAVYISTPHPMHAEWAIKAAEAGKHILVEKPIAMNQYEATSMITAAKVNGVFLMEAFMYRCNPQTLMLRQLLREKPIGDIAVIKATFSFGSGLGTRGRIWQNDLGGGGILDVGGYTTSFARLVAGEAIGKPFAEPLNVVGGAFLNPETGVDAWAAAILEFDNGLIAQLSTGVGVAQDNGVQIFGTQGKIVVLNPYVCSRETSETGEILIHKRGAAPETVSLPCPVTSYTYEADVCGRAIQAGRSQTDEMSWDDTMGNIRTLDRWREAVGLVYENEKPNDGIVKG